MHFSFPLSVVATLLCAFLEQNKRPAHWLPFNLLTSYARLITSFVLALPYSTLVVWLLAACCENVGEMPPNCREGVVSETSIHTPAYLTVPGRMVAPVCSESFLEGVMNSSNLS